MAGRNLDADMLIGASAGVKASMLSQHWKYPQTVGNDTVADDIHFNSHESSEYSIKRMSVISETTHEPFVMFEFMEINQTLANEKAMEESRKISNLMKEEKTLDYWKFDQYRNEEGGMRGRRSADEFHSGEGNNFLWHKSLINWLGKYTTAAERQYTGSIALYMPTDIQINDSMVYNEDTRKLGAALETLARGDEGEFIREGDGTLNLTILTDPAVLALGGAAIGALPFIPGGAAVGAVLTGTLGQVAQTEVQRHTGRIMNPNELTKYQQTALRTFTFNWIILPDNEYESDQAAGLIKFFRKSAHAKKTSSTMVTVPDHVITSFHGAKDMIQLPPCFVESVNVTYNPNNSSFFKRNNAPVEIGLAVGLKEIVPIYADDVERGY